MSRLVEIEMDQEIPCLLLNRPEAFNTLNMDMAESLATLLRCDECGQLYFHEFYGETDWKEGKGAQYITWIPIDDAESGDELNRMSLLALLVYSSIRYDYPMGANEPTGPYWSCPRDPSRAT